MNTVTGKQSGITLIGLIFTLALIGFVALIAFRLLPIYIEYFNIVTSMESLENEPEFALKSKQDILRLLNNRLDINDVEAIETKDIRINQEPGVTKVGVKYEVRKPMFYNIDVVVKFDKTVEVSTN